MSDEELDQLAESARNRGLKLVRSRVRTPGKQRFGKVGLTDKGGKAVFGMDGKGPAAKPEEVEQYLRNVGAKDWGASLGVAVMPRKRKKPKPQAANDAEPEPPRARPKREKPAKPPKPKPEPKLAIRDAKPSDAAALVELIILLGHEIDEQSVRKNLKKLAKLGEPPLVATLDKQVIALCGVHTTTTVHRDAPVGRMTVLAVAERAQGTGIGRKWVEQAEAILRKAGCKIVEVTSNDRRGAAHAFYRHLGYERTSMRFMKKLS